MPKIKICAYPLSLGERGGYTRKFYMGRFCLKVQPLVNHFDRKDTLFAHLSLKNGTLFTYFDNEPVLSKLAKKGSLSLSRCA